MKDTVYIGPLELIRRPTRSPRSALEQLGVDTSSPERLIQTIPFSMGDTTAGSENELQAVVLGDKRDVDLPTTIEQSSYFANLLKRTSAGDTSRRIITQLEGYLDHNPGCVWENSWVRFSLDLLSPLAREILDHDLLADKKDPGKGVRKDIDRFVFRQRGQESLRIPISYLIKLALVDHIGSQHGLPLSVHQTGWKLLAHFLSDNTSPEVFSFHVIPVHLDSGMGKSIAREASKRFLLTQLLAMYANEKFMLRSSGQHAMIYFAPHPPVRQKQLNECISDAFYRELLMSPCLSGWDKGEAKHHYMGLCHEVLSRSHLNAVAKLREAGVITRNLVVLPNVSNISLANNGTHISLGSRMLSRCLRAKDSGFTRADEKCVGDLVIKIVEHFLPLFVGTYSGAPYRIDFMDFHPEKVLGFLPHELDYTHLRMIWRRWKKKAKNSIFGHPLTPFGPSIIDRAISALFRLKGDFVGDFRLVDYFVALMSTETSPGLDGTVGNGERLKQDLARFGIFDARMATYLMCRLREYESMGFSGFEGRTYSLFESLNEDMARASNLQILITCLAFKYIAQGRINHCHIPDVPLLKASAGRSFLARPSGYPPFTLVKTLAIHS